MFCLCAFPLCPFVSLCVPLCPFMPLFHPFTCNAPSVCIPYVSLWAPLCPFMPLYAPWCPLMPLYAPSCPFMPLYAPSCPFMSLHAPLHPLILTSSIKVHSFLGLHFNAVASPILIYLEVITTRTDVERNKLVIEKSILKSIFIGQSRDQAKGLRLCQICRYIYLRGKNVAECERYQFIKCRWDRQFYPTMVLTQAESRVRLPSVSLLSPLPSPLMDRSHTGTAFVSLPTPHSQPPTSSLPIHPSCSLLIFQTPTIKHYFNFLPSNNSRPGMMKNAF